jgi:cholesterol transport system auxiliary component
MKADGGGRVPGSRGLGLIVVASGAAALLTGCLSLGGGAYPERRAFLPDARREGPPRAAAAGTALLVRPFRISPAFEGREFVYRTGADAFASDFYNLFFVPPAALVTDAARRWIAGARLFDHVVSGRSWIEPTHVLEGNVVTVYGDLRAPASTRAVLEVQLLLLDDAVDPPRVLADRTYRQEAPVPDASAEALAGGWGRALAEILKEAEADWARLDRATTKPKEGGKR